MTKMTKLQACQRRLLEAEASAVGRLGSAYAELPKGSRSKMMASGLVVSITRIGGEPLAPPFMLRDGMSEELIEELRNEIVRSARVALSYAPQRALPPGFQVEGKS